ncbi:MAG: PAS domain S-box protein [Dehalococcoidia bacterium]|nr:PAS domain S-box protein [Dehalococcoidia bacterium]
MSPSKSSKAKTKIVIAEDSHTQAEQLKHMLEEHGFQVYAAANGKEAIELIGKHQPPIVLSDVIMPEMDGYELCRYIKSKEKMRGIAVILVTALSEPKDIIRGLECGADNFITKPYEGKFLLSRILYLLANRELREAEKAQLGIDISFAGDRYHITSDRLQILNLLLSTYEVAVQKNAELTGAHEELRKLNVQLEQRVRERTAEFKESNDFNVSLLENSPNPIAVLNPDTLIKYVNPAFEKMTGYNEAEILGIKPPFPWWPEDMRDEILTLFKTDMLARGVQRERMFKRKNGELFSVVIYDSDVESERKLKYRFSNWIDITERKKAEEASRESEEFSTSLMENAPNPIYVLNPDFSLRYVNPALERLTAYSEAELIGTRPPFPWWPQDKRDEIMASFNKSMLDGYSYVERAFIKKTGEPFWTEVSYARIESRGKVKYHLTNGVDITERKRAEEVLRNSEERLRRMFDSVTEGIIVVDLDGKITMVNETLVGMSGCETRDKLIGRSIFEFVASRDRSRAMSDFMKTIKQGFISNTEYAIVAGDGREFPAELSAAVIHDLQGNPVEIVGALKDITERRKMEAQLVITDRLASIGELASGIAHELNNPLTSVIGFAQLLLERDVPEDLKEDLKIVNREALRTADVVRGLLTFARKHAPVKAPANVHNILKNVLQMRAYEQKVDNIEVITRFTDMPEVMADFFQLQQVFLNIIINAEYFMIETHRRGKLTVTTERVGDMARIAIADDGPGITPENLGHIFDPFFTTKPVGKGTGLGLSICHGIVANHGGKIYVESIPGEGATFYVEIPFEKSST